MDSLSFSEARVTVAFDSLERIKATPRSALAPRLPELNESPGKNHNASAHRRSRFSIYKIARIRRNSSFAG